MTLDERISLILPGVERAAGTWADLGAGSGAFTLALAAILGPGAVIHAVDRDRRALASLESEAASVRGPGAPRIVTVHADLARDLSLPPLDGALAANALHYVADVCAVLARIRARLKPGAPLIVVEYDIERANPWVPHPLPWSKLPAAAACAGFETPRLLGARPSTYHRSMYAASCGTTASR